MPIALSDGETYELLGGTLHQVPAPGTSRRCSACGITTPGSRESQAVFVCKNPDCGWTGNADHNAARNVLHLYRTGLARVSVAGRAVVRRAKRVSPLPQGRQESPGFGRESTPKPRLPALPPRSARDIPSDGQW